MAFTCGFFNSENGDRKYNAEQMSAIFDGIIADGVFTTIGDHMAVTAGTGMQVLVGTGKAWFDHTWNVNDAAYPLTIAASDVTLSRIDAIVLETNHSDSVRLNKLRVVQGTVASSPVKPTLTNSEKVHQHPLAWVTVAPGVTQIAASAIENAVGTSACPFVTGIIATTDIDDLFAQWNGEFDEWFDNLKAQLSDNVVANLQKQIDARVKIADKATSDDVAQGTDDSKWVTPKSVKEGIKNSIDEITNVGDIKTTIRTNLDDKWLLCNGAYIDAGQYPKLIEAGVTGGAGILNKGETAVTVASSKYTSGMASDGTTILYAVVDEVKNSHIYIYTSTSPTQNPALVATISFTGYPLEVFGAYYWDGLWVVGYSRSTESGGDKTRRGIAFSQSPSGPWSYKDIDVSQRVNSIGSLAFDTTSLCIPMTVTGNGIGKIESIFTITKSSLLSGGSFVAGATYTDLGYAPTGTFYIQSLTYIPDHGFACIAINFWNGSDDKWHSRRLLITASDAGFMSNRKVRIIENGGPWSDYSDQLYLSPVSIGYHNDQIIAFMNHNKNNQNDSKSLYCYTAPFNAYNFTKRRVGLTTPAAAFRNSPICYNGIIVVPTLDANAPYLSCLDINGTVLLNVPAQHGSRDAMQSYTSPTGHFILCPYQYLATVTNIYGDIASQVWQLPLITTDKSYNYIKVKE